jgi:phage terminase small subunit
MRPKTKEEKEMQGTFEPSKPQIEGVEFELLERNPSCPDNWPEEAKTIWRDVCSFLKSVNHLSKAYVPVIEEYSWAVYRCQVAKEKLISKPDDNFWEKVLNTNTKRMERLTVKLGFSPLDSMKVPSKKKGGDSEMSLLK